jgi:hypothetical protein
VLYTHDGSNTTSDSFSYTVEDPTGNTLAGQTFNITVSPVNDAPTAADNTVTTNEDTAYVFTASDFNFSDADGDTLASVQITSLESVGSLQLAGLDVSLNQVISRAAIDAGQLTFNPVAEANGADYDSFGFSVNDGTNDSVASYTLTVDVTAVNDAPLASGNTVATTEDNAHYFAASDFTYFDVESDSMVSATLTNLSLAGGTLIHSGGIVVGDGDTLTAAQLDSLVYTPTTDANGLPLATFDYTVNDGDVGVFAATMSVDVTPVNDAPVAGNDVTSVSEGGSVVIAATANDSDIDSPIDFNSIVITSLPANGSVIVNGDGTVTYSHNGSETLSDSFSYTISDISGAVSNTATVSISVNPFNDAPSAGDDAVSVAEGDTTVIDLAANDTDADNALDLNSITIIGAPAHGALLVNGDGTVTYSHDGSNTTSDSFSYTIADISGAISNSATVAINVTVVNDAPTTSGIADVTVDEDAPATSIDLNAAFDDSDNLDSELHYNIVGNTDIGLFSAAGIDGNGQLTLAYAANMNGATQITIRATDPSGQSVDTLFTVNVMPVNDNPVLQANNGMMAANGTATTIDSDALHATDIDNPSTEVIYTLTELPANGTLMLNGVAMTVNDSFTQADVDNNRMVYVASGKVASDQFGFMVSDTSGGTLGDRRFNVAVQLRPVSEQSSTNTTTETAVSAGEEPEAQPQEQTVLESGSGGLVDGGGGYGGEFVPFGSAAVPPPPTPTPVLSVEPIATTELSAPRQITSLEEIGIVGEVEDYELSTFAAVQMQSMDALWTSVDKMKQEMAESAAQMDMGELKVAAAKSSGVVLTAGIVAWAMRGGALLSSLMSTIPLWKGYDPLPVLAYKDDEDDDKGKANEKVIDEDMIPTSLDELKKLKALKAKEIDVDALFGDSAIRE